MNLGKVRFRLLIAWLMLFLFYFAVFLVLPFVRREISDHDAHEAAWKTAYIFLPLLTAFATYYFAVDFSAKSEDTETIHPRQAYVAYC